jgi:hypothetical protein
MRKQAVFEAKRKKLSRGYDMLLRYFIVKGGFETSRLMKVEFIYKWLQFQFFSHYFGDIPNWRLRLRRLDKMRTLPDFCVIGAIKSGTSDLAVNLLLHPNVMTPFSKEFASGDPEQWRVYYPTLTAKQRHAKKYGLALSPYLSPYLHRSDIMQNLSSVRPGTKIVLALRDPAKRFYSQWKWEVLRAGRKGTARFPFLATFPAFVDEALKAYGSYRLNTPCGFDPVATSIYTEAVAGWINAFGRENVLVLDVDAYYKAPCDFLQQIYRFVGLPPFDMPPAASRVLENPLVLPAADESSMGRLREFFKSHNESLWDLIGERFAWG